MNLYLYFSGTGNTKYVITKLSELLDKDNAYKIISIEHSQVDYSKLIESAETITIAYPIYDSMLPFIISEFLVEYKESFRNKNIITLATQLLFSGDGGALPYYILKDVNVNHLHSIHINMPSNLVDINLFPNKPIEKTDKKVIKADAKIKKVAENILSKKTIKDGRRWYSWGLGYFVQRAHGKRLLKKLRSRVKIDQEKCINCNKCVDACPMDNLYNMDGIIEVRDKCTLCYRCVNLCPTKSISIFMKKKPKVQYIREDYN